LNENAATLHYTELTDSYPENRHSMLIDAGASFNGYACDITRTYGSAGEFTALIAAVDELQQALCASVTAGRSYVDIHLQAHALVGSALANLGLVNCSSESAVEQGITSVFLPHGIGHFIGLQVHDVGGHQANPEGAVAPPPERHPFLRLTRTLEPGHVVTIEPGIYIIDQLLEDARNQAFASDINWSQVARLRPFGGVRIEDDVVCTDNAPENLTRDAFAAL
ncbi:MAG: M24 family metallopeptidase, partial [Pseudomonadota bacterium]